ACGPISRIWRFARVVTSTWPPPWRREVAHAAELPRREHASGDPEPAHEGILRRGDVEQARELVQEDVSILGKDAPAGIGPDLVPEGEPVLVALGLLLLRERLARGEESVLGLGVDLLRPGGPRGGRTESE